MAFHIAMPTLLETRVIGTVCSENIAAIGAAAADESLAWEEVSAIASRGNAELMRLLETLPGTIDRLADEAAMNAYMVGAKMAEQAMPHTDPENILDLYEGASAIAMRVREQVQAGGILPMNYMDMRTRKAIFLVESAFNAPAKK